MNQGGTNGTVYPYPEFAALPTLARTGAQTLVLSMPDGSSETFTEDAHSGAGVLTSKTDRQGRTWNYTHDTVTHTIPAGPNPWPVAPEGTSGGSGTLASSYTSLGALTSITDPAGQRITFTSTTYTNTTGAQTTFAMDASRRVTRVTTPLNHVIETGYANFDTATSIDGNGHRTSYVYDSQGRLVEVGNAAGEQTSFTYTSQGDLTSRTDPTGATTSYTVDGQGRTTAVAGPDGAHWQQSFDSRGNLTSRTDPDGHTTGYGYDPRGNLTTITDALSGKTILGYDRANRLVSTTDPLGRKTTFGYDVAGNLQSRTDATGAVTRYTYQQDDKVATVTDPRGGITSYTYNNGLNLATITAPDGGVASYGYDSEYRRTSVTDPDGRVTKYAYDAEALVTAITDPAGKVTKRGYDAAQNLTSVTDPTGATTGIAYDAADRPTQVSDPRGGKTVFAHDAAGRITSVTDPLNRATSYTSMTSSAWVRMTGTTRACLAGPVKLAGRATRQPLRPTCAWTRYEQAAAEFRRCRYPLRCRRRIVPDRWIVRNLGCGRRGIRLLWLAREFLRHRLRLSGYLPLLARFAPNLKRRQARPGQW